MINCPNPSCKTANPEEAQVCQVCQAVLPHYYLWGVGDLVASLKPGTLLNQRYLLKCDRVFLDTKPGLTPESLPEIPDFLLPYLHLSAYPLHVPRLYSVLRTPDKEHVLMLESSALRTATASAGKAQNTLPEPLPRLINSWAEAPPLRQLGWLWQIAQIWEAFAAEQVATTLLDSTLLRVDGSIVRLLELASPALLVAQQAAGSTELSAAGTADKRPTLVDLARSWQPLAESAHQAVRPFLTRLYEKMERQQLNTEQVSEQLSQAMTVCGEGQDIAYQLSVQTDQGPTRKRNEDACFPENGTTLSLTSEQTQKTPQLLIVCDGIGGHQGGDVASKLAITTITQRLAPTMAEGSPVLTSTELSLAIEAAICAANDEISAQNDQAQRQARDRMGTTLVLAYIQGPEVYIAHLGDSRAYRISHRNCQQVTLDDDVASRQVRLGGSLYREVLMQPGSGSLIQALGMGPSQSLRPTVQRFVIDETCAFLLCSDGLSDSDRVEQYWQQELSPLVSGERSASEVGPRLVNLANQYNGHDNVTVGLIKAQVNGASDRIVPRELAAEAGEIATTKIPGNGKGTAAGQAAAGNTPGSVRKGKRPTTQLVAASAPAATAAAKPAAKTVQMTAGERPEKKRGGKLKLLGALLLLLAIAGGLAFALVPGIKELILPGNNTPAVPGSETSEGSEPPPEIPSRPLPAIEVDGYFRVIRTPERVIDRSGISTEREGTEREGIEPENTERENEVSRSPEPVTGLAVYVRPERGIDVEVNGNINEIPSIVSVGSILRVESERLVQEQRWLRIQLCSVPGASDNDVPGDEAIDSVPDDSDVNPYSVVENTEQPIRYKVGDDPGWASENSLQAAVEVVDLPSSSQKGPCEG
ncbi:MAG: protein phosphatase 2C domain-containing protein [Cyanobacteria bacterium J06581_3]